VGAFASVRDPSYPLPEPKPWWKRSQMKGVVISAAGLALLIAAQLWPAVPWGEQSLASLAVVTNVAALVWDHGKNASVTLVEAHRAQAEGIKVGKAQRKSEEP